MATNLLGIFANGVAGMMATSQAMGAISDNIANQNTVGYKRVETMFSTLVGRVEATVQGDGSFSPHLIARNTSGVRASTRQFVDVQGAILSTGRQYDLAINGGGMFVFGDDVDAPESFSYGRAGDFNALIPIEVTDTTVTADTRSFLANKNGQFLLAMPVTGGVIPTTAPTSVDELVTVQVSDQAAFAGQATTTAELAAMIPASGATTVSTPIFYVDAAGDRQGLTLEFSNPTVNAGVDTTWDITVYDSSSTIVMGPLAGAVVFDNTGQITTGSPLTITAGTDTFDLDMTNVAMLGDATSGQAIQIGYTQDGLEAGAFEGLTFSRDGVIYGRYSGGGTQALYRIPIASFGNPNGLQPLAGNVYQESEGSGEVEFRLLGDEFSRLELNAVESANVDLAEQFSQMIITQRAYSSAAQIVSTADEMSLVARDLI
jgi:flagellar hook protein FlgE